MPNEMITRLRISISTESHEIIFINVVIMRKRTKIRNRYNQTSHLVQDTNGKVTTSQLDITNESQEISPFPAGDQKALSNRHAREHNTNKTKNINDPQKKHNLGTVSKIFTGGLKPVSQRANLTLSRK